MVDTSHNLLRDAKADFRSENWNRFVRIYSPLIARWLSRFGASTAEIPDLTQDVLLAASTDLARFEHNGRKGAFRNWLRTVALHRCRRHWQQKQRQITAHQFDTASQQIDELSDPRSELSEMWDREHDEYVLRGLFELLERDFDGTSLEVFRRLTILGESPAECAQRFGWTIGRVYKVKYRVMRRLRENGQMFLE